MLEPNMCSTVGSEMTDNRIDAAEAPEPVGAYPHARRVGNLLFLSGVGPRKKGKQRNPRGRIGCNQGNIVSYDIAEQCRSVFENVTDGRRRGGFASWMNIVDVTVFLTNMKDDFATYNQLYAEYFKDNQPCRTTDRDILTSDAYRHRIKVHCHTESIRILLSVARPIFGV